MKSSFLSGLMVFVIACSGAKPGAGPTHAPTNDPSVGPLTITPAGIGQVRAGMTLAEANAKFGNALDTIYKLQPECDYVTTANHNPDVLFMIVHGRLRRIDVRDTTITTANGARIGMSEDSLLALYQGRFAIGGHKYVNGHYVVIQPEVPTDSFRIVFETEEGKVTRFRSGLEPQVEWVEGCA